MAVNKIRVVAMVVTGVALAMNAIGQGTDYWVESDNPPWHFGLWRGCITQQGLEYCGTITSVGTVDAKLEAARALTILPLIMGVGSNVLLGLSMRRQGTATRVMPVVFSFIQGVFTAGGLGAAKLFYDEIDPNHILSYAWSAYITIVACVFYFIAGILAAVSLRFGSQVAAGYTSFPAGDGYKS